MASRLRLPSHLNKKLMASVLCGLLLAHPAFARVFDSPLKLKVYARGSAEIPDRVLGFTPSRKGHPIRVPAHGVWYVRPVGPLNARRLEQLAHLMTRERIPGIDLSDHWELTNDSLSHLKSVAHLAMLDILRTNISAHGLAPLPACRHLVVRIVPETITDAGLSHLTGLAELRELNLD